MRARDRRSDNSFDEISPAHVAALRGQHTISDSSIAGRKTRKRLQLMSALGQKQTCAVRRPMSALAPIATSIAFFGMSALRRQKRPRPLNFSLFPLLAQKAAASHVLMTAAELLCAEWPGDGVKAARRSHAPLNTR